MSVSAAAPHSRTLAAVAIWCSGEADQERLLGPRCRGAEQQGHARLAPRRERAVSAERGQHCVDFVQQLRVCRGVCVSDDRQCTGGLGQLKLNAGGSPHANKTRALPCLERALLSAAQPRLALCVGAPLPRLLGLLLREQCCLSRLSKGQTRRQGCYVA